MHTTDPSTPPTRQPRKRTRFRLWHLVTPLSVIGLGWFTAYSVGTIPPGPFVAIMLVMCIALAAANFLLYYFDL